MERNTLDFEQIGDEIYVVCSGITIGRILDQGADNYYLIFEDSDVKIPFHGLDSAKQYIKCNLSEYLSLIKQGKFTKRYEDRIC